MNYIQLTSTPYPLEKLRREVYMNSSLYDEDNSRQTYTGSAHKDTRVMYLRMSDTEGKEGVELFNTFINDIWVNDTNMFLFPNIREVVLDVMHIVQGVELGRVLIVELAPNASILPHRDEGLYPQYYERYHIPLISDNCTFTIGDDKVDMKEGHLYLIDNLVEHSVENNSNTPRVHLIMDIRG